MGCQTAFVRQLRERGFRLTPQREMILSVLHDVDGLATADEIYGRVQQISPAVDLSTVYRTLELLQGLGLVDCVEVPDGQRRYELLGLHGPHVHLVCEACGNVSAVELEMARDFAAALQAACGFQARIERLSVPGLCQACATAARP